MFCFVWRIKQCAKTTNKELLCHHLTSLCVGSHRWQGGGLLLIGQRTKEQPFPSQRAEETLPETTETQLPHHCITINGREGTAAKVPTWCPFVKNWSHAWGSLWSNQETEVALQIASDATRISTVVHQVRGGWAHTNLCSHSCQVYHCLQSHFLKNGTPGRILLLAEIILT